MKSEILARYFNQNLSEICEHNKLYKSHIKLHLRLTMAANRNKILIPTKCYSCGTIVNYPGSGYGIP